MRFFNVLFLWGSCGAGGSRSCQLVSGWCFPCCFSVLLVVFGVGGRRVPCRRRAASRCSRSCSSFGWRSGLFSVRCSSFGRFSVGCCSFGSLVLLFGRFGVVPCGRRVVGLSFLRLLCLPCGLLGSSGLSVLRLSAVVRAWFCSFGRGWVLPSRLPPNGGARKKTQTKENAK